MNSHFVEYPDVIRYPRVKKSNRDATVARWNDEMSAFFPTRRKYRIQIGKLLVQIKWLKGHGNFRSWFDEQGYEFGFRSAENYMSEALEYCRNTKNFSYSPMRKTDEVHEATAKKTAELDNKTYQFILYGLTSEEIQRLKSLRKTEERGKAHAAVIQALQPWLKGDRSAHHTT